MIDYLIAFAVVCAVVVFGVLIVVGNERQKRELARIREIEQQWAQQDLRIKRGQAAKQIDIQDASAWLSKALTLAINEPVDLKNKEVLQDPDAVSFTDVRSGRRMIFTVLDPDQIRRLARRRKASRAARLSAYHPLMNTRSAQVVEMSMLNSGLLFDLELPVGWKLLTGQETLTGQALAYVL